MLKIKLFPRGKKHQRTFRLVVAEARSKSNGKVVADLGFFTPQTKTLNYDKAKLAQWIKNGAQLTFGVDRLLNPDKFPKKVKVKPKKVATAPVAPPAPVSAEPAATATSETAIDTPIVSENIPEADTTPETTN